MARRKMQPGTCLLCGQDKLLNFEHVPPKSAFNKSTRYVSVPSDEYTKISNPIKNPPKGKILQGGTGYYAFCEDCNNFLGRNYVPSYNRWVNAGAVILGKFPPNINSVLFTATQVEPLSILKQVVSMLLALNDATYLKAYPELSSFVRDPNSRELPEKYQVYAYLNNEGQLRHKSHSLVSAPEFGMVNCTELAFPPFGYVLTMDHEGKLGKLTNITNFKMYYPSEKVDLPIGLLKLPTYIPLSPLDYRSKEQIEKAINLSEEYRRKHNL